MAASEPMPLSEVYLALSIEQIQHGAKPVVVQTADGRYLGTVGEVYSGPDGVILATVKRDPRAGGAE